MGKLVIDICLWMKGWDDGRKKRKMVLLSLHQFSIHLLPFGWSWSHHHHCYANILYRSFFTTQKRNRQQHNRSNIHNISLQYKSLGKRMYVIDDSIWCPTFDSYSRKRLNPLLRDFFFKRGNYNTKAWLNAELYGNST